jgi:predicted nucleotide-binding protein
LETFLLSLGVIPLIVKKEPSLDKTVDDKVEFYLNQADFVIILATGDDAFEEKLHP